MLVREVAYGRLPRRARAELHVLAADWLEERLAQGRDDQLKPLAHHLLTAIDEGADDALRDRLAVCSIAPAGARSRSAPAGQRSPAPLGAHGGRPRRPRSTRGSCSSWAPCCSPSRPGWTSPTEAREQFLERDDTEHAALAEIRIAALLHVQGEGQAASSFADQAWERVRDVPPTRTSIRVAAMYASDIAVASRLREAEAVARHVIEVAPGFGMDEPHANALMVLGLCRTGQGDASGLDHLSGAVAILRRIGRPTGTALANLAHGYWQLGDVRTAIATEREALADARRRETRGAIEYTSVTIWPRSRTPLVTGARRTRARSGRGTACRRVVPSGRRCGSCSTRSPWPAAEGEEATSFQPRRSPARATSRSRGVLRGPRLRGDHGRRGRRPQGRARPPRGLLAMLDRDTIHEHAYLVAPALARAARATGLGDRARELLLAASDNPWAASAIAHLEERFADAATAYDTIGSVADAAEERLCLAGQGWRRLATRMRAALPVRRRRRRLVRGRRPARSNAGRPAGRDSVAEERSAGGRGVLGE